MVVSGVISWVAGKEVFPTALFRLTMIVGNKNASERHCKPYNISYYYVGSTRAVRLFLRVTKNRYSNQIAHPLIATPSCAIRCIRCRGREQKKKLGLPQ